MQPFESYKKCKKMRTGDGTAASDVDDLKKKTRFIPHSFDINTNDPNLIKRFVSFIRSRVLNLMNDIETRRCSSKDAAVKNKSRQLRSKPTRKQRGGSSRMLVIQPARRSRSDEELRTVGLGPGVGHADGVRSIVA